MDLRSSFASNDLPDIEVLHAQMKNVYATQAEHADRLMRLEQRSDGDGRLRAAWGSQTHLSQGQFAQRMHISNEPVADIDYNPAAEAFKNFDQSQSLSMVGSLNLDAEDEPRRGTSRANSVRFDESATQGFAPTPRVAVSNEPFLSRSGSAIGQHPLYERSSSHKSDGRQSSASHSARASSVGFEPRPSSGLSAPSTPAFGPPPGLFLLGPVPSIIRCWLSTEFSTDSLLYAAICTGSYRSTINSALLEALDDSRMVKLPVYLPEATVQQISSRGPSELPTLTTEFHVVEGARLRGVDIILGCDVLRYRNATISFGQDRLTLLDDERNQISVPLSRPENAAIFQDLQTTQQNVLEPTKINGGKIYRPPIKTGQQDDLSESRDPKVEPVAPTNTSLRGSWRRDGPSVSASGTKDDQQRSARMKVLKPNRLNTQSGPQSPSNSEKTPATAGPLRHIDSFRGGTGTTEPVKKSSNPIGGGSAFGWLNGAPKS